MPESSFLTTLFSGQVLAALGIALAMILPAIGSSKGVSLVAESASGLLTEDPKKFGKAFLLVALPSSQAIYGFVTAALILFLKLPSIETVADGGYFLMASLPIAVGGLISAVKQGRVAASGISLIAKRPDQSGKALLNAAMVETFAIFSLLVSLLMVVLH